VASTHRPLSRYIRLVNSEAGLSLDINFGAEDADARQLPTFSSGWTRTAIPVEDKLGSPTSALGLHSERFAVVEVDSFGIPIEATPQAVQVVNALEENWPPKHFDTTTAATLSNQSGYLTAALINRIGEKDDADSTVYHILPWHLVESLARSIASGMPADTAASKATLPPRLGPWFTSAVSGLVGSLEQMAEASTRGEAEIMRSGTTSLMNALRGGDIARIPPATRVALAQLVATIAGSDVVFEQSAPFILARLGQPTSETPLITVTEEEPNVVEFEWAVPRSQVQYTREKLTERGATLNLQTRLFQPPHDEAIDYAAAAFEPLMLIFGSVSLGDLMEKASDAVNDPRHGGAIIDIRESQLQLRSNPAVPRGTILVITAREVHTLHNPAPSELQQIIDDSLRS